LQEAARACPASAPCPLEIANAATLIVQPTGASLDDLRPAVLLFHELVRAGVPHDRLVMALSRILSDAEEARARAYIEAAGYDVLPGYVPERTAYREAHNRGHAVTETTLHLRLDQLMEGLYTRVAEQLQAQKKQVRKRKKAS
jgi:chromosome partitioning protein